MVAGGYPPRSQRVLPSAGVGYSPGYTFGVQVLRGGTGASGEHGEHGVRRWICYDRKDGTVGDETKWKGRNHANLANSPTRPDSVKYFPPAKVWAVLSLGLASWE